MASGINSWIDEITIYLENHPKVILAFLFGSFAKGKARPASDADVAIYEDSPFTPADGSSIWNKIENIAHKDVDLVLLNHAPPGVAWATMKGKVLVDKNPRLRLELILQVAREAEDFREFQTDFWRRRSLRWR